MNHINGNKSDNRPENLEHLTPAENVQHAHTSGLIRQVRGEDVATAKLAEADIREIRSTPQVYGSVTRMARRYGVNRTTIYNVLNRETWNHV